MFPTGHLLLVCWMTEKGRLLPDAAVLRLSGLAGFRRTEDGHRQASSLDKVRSFQQLLRSRRMGLPIVQANDTAQESKRRGRR